MKVGKRVRLYGPQVGNSTNRHADGPMTRVCPKCGALPTWRCFRFVGARQVPCKTVHSERRTPRAERS